jgi:excisionase family DNA binding protein
MREDLPSFLTVQEVATLLRLSAETVREQIRVGELPAYRIGGEYRVHRDELLEFLRHRRTKEFPGTLT